MQLSYAFPELFWKSKKEGRSIMFITLDPHTAVVRVGDFLNNGKTQSGSRRAESSFGSPVKAIENPFALRCRDGRPFVAYFGNDFRLAYRYPYVDRRIRNRILERVVEKLSQRSLHELSVAAYGNFVANLPQSKSFALTRLIESFNCRSQQTRKQKRLMLRLKIRTLEPRSCQ